jgi:hypothetical protein
MNVAFLTEMNFRGKVPVTHPNARTEFAWMIALGSDHFNIMEYEKVSGYDWVFVIFPKGGVSLNSEGIRLNDQPNRFSDLYKIPFIEILKKQNKRVAYVQEGPTWFINDFTLTDQFNIFNNMAECDVIFAHNEYDTNWYKGWFPGKKVTVIPTLMIEELIRDITPKPEEKAIVGGNFCRWYGGFQSYLVSAEFGVPIWTQTSHASQPGEDQVMQILPRVQWVDWIRQLSSFKYAVHLMPTVAAGTFSLNCAYFGIPCIGNRNVDTQKICFPHISVEAEDVDSARYLAKKLKEDPEFYDAHSKFAKEQYQKRFSIREWKAEMIPFLEENL